MVTCLARISTPGFCGAAGCASLARLSPVVVEPEIEEAFWLAGSVPSGVSVVLFVFAPLAAEVPEVELELPEPGVPVMLLFCIPA